MKHTTFCWVPDAHPDCAGVEDLKVLFDLLDDTGDGEISAPQRGQCGGVESSPRAVFFHWWTDGCSAYTEKRRNNIHPGDCVDGEENTEHWTILNTSEHP